jgi:two-component system NarL family response regulator
MTDPIRVMVVEDHAVVRQGLIALLSSAPDIEVVTSAADGVEAVKAHSQYKPQVTLIDLNLPRMGGVEAITTIRASDPAAQFIVLTTFDGDEDIFRAMQAGAKAYLLKGTDIDEVLATIRAVHSGKSRIPPDVAEKLAERISRQELTTRELDTLERIVAGRSNKQIASDLNISEATVKSHVNSLLGKLGADDRTQAAIIAVQRGFVRLPEDRR